MTLFRRLRGALATSATWAIAFAALSSLVAIGARAVGLLPLLTLTPFLRELATVGFRWGMIGAGTGLLFAAAIIAAERHRTLFTLSARRFILWGVAAGSGLPVGVTVVLLLRDRSSIPGLVAPGVIIALVGGVVGAAMAALSLRVARKTLLSSGFAVAGLSPGTATQTPSANVSSRKARPPVI